MMAELTPGEKLQPCLLDRLTDHEPHKTQESRSQRVMSMSQYRQAVLRDLAWLLNTDAHREDEDLNEFEQLPASVLNYGVQSLTGRAASSINADDLRYQVNEAIRRFEPRIIPNTISIIMTLDPDEMSHRSLQFEIRGDLWTQPIPESLFIRTEIDLETGKCELNRSSGG